MTCPKVGNNLPKGGLIPHVMMRVMLHQESRKALLEGLASDELVGRVTAYQGEDR